MNDTDGRGHVFKGISLMVLSMFTRYGFSDDSSPRQLVDLLRAHAELQQDFARVLAGTRPCMMKPFRVRACGQVDRGADQIDIPERRVRR
ncbi:MAG: hypothetical protein VW835_14960, partial [Rickettsiales bacterium]